MKLFRRHGLLDMKTGAGHSLWGLDMTKSKLDPMFAERSPARLSTCKMSRVVSDGRHRASCMGDGPPITQRTWGLGDRPLQTWIRSHSSAGCQLMVAWSFQSCIMLSCFVAISVATHVTGRQPHESQGARLAPRPGRENRKGHRRNRDLRCA